MQCHRVLMACRIRNSNEIKQVNIQKLVIHFAMPARLDVTLKMLQEVVDIVQQDTKVLTIKRTENRIAFIVFQGTTNKKF